MNSKLTLKLNQEIIEKAKMYASDRKISLSRLIENYLGSLTSDNKNNSDEIDISPIIKSFKTGVKIPADLDIKNGYRKHLEKKYQ